MPLAILAAATPAGGKIFSSPPPNPRLSDPLPSRPPPPLPKRKFSLPPPKKSPTNPALKSTHSRTRYYKPVTPGHVLTTSPSGDRSVVVGESGVSFLLPDAPFEFQFSYSETPKAKPIAIREPAFLPFGPPSMPRPWTGKAPLLSKKDKERKKKVRIFEPLGEEGTVEGGRVMRMVGPNVEKLSGRCSVDGRSREEILGAPLTRREVVQLVKPCLSHNRQVNLGRDGLTHNMLELVHSHWRRQEVCKVRCRGVPTVDMDNVCYHLEEKTGGKIIHRTGGVVYLFRGRNYDPRTRPRYPIMLWKPATPVYPKLIQEAPEGLTKIEADELRKKGQSLLPICKLAKNGIYIDLVKDVRDAFERSHLVKINCEGMHASDYKKIGAKLKELVPCVLLSFDQEQILMWRGKDWKPRYQTTIPSVSKLQLSESSMPSDLKSSGPSTDVDDECTARKGISSSKMMTLWKRAIDSCKALLLDETDMGPDSLLERVEEFARLSQASEHSYSALILSSGKEANVSEATAHEERSEAESNDEFRDKASYYDDFEDYGSGVSDSFEEMEHSVPFGSLPVDSIVDCQLNPDS